MDLIKFYKSIVRPKQEYVVQAWVTGITQEQCDMRENVQNELLSYSSQTITKRTLKA